MSQVKMQKKVWT